MKLSFIICLYLAFGMQLASAQSSDRPTINVTSDSPKSWRPTAEQMRSASLAAAAFLETKDKGKTDFAYEMLAGEMQKYVSKPDYSKSIIEFNLEAGKGRRHNVSQVTWTKDPPSGPSPGVFAAFDITSKYENIDRACGFLIMYQLPNGGPFKVMRTEINFMSNVAAADILKNKSQAELDKLWKQISAKCPNYKP